ncbi:MAG TPA: 50S ribosomal protein L22 [Limnochordia bacterium]|nr:50S ribosomal protein L22 [Limnochordia bacterium]
METKATAKYVRMTPRKARQIVDLIRGKSVPEAMAILHFHSKRGADVVGKVLKSAAANAENNHSLDAGAMLVKSAWVDEGPTMKRVMPRARGMADRVLKRSSHITVVLSERE